MDDVRNVLTELILDDLKEIKRMQDSDERNKAIDNVNILLKDLIAYSEATTKALDQEAKRQYSEDEISLRMQELTVRQAELEEKKSSSEAELKQRQLEADEDLKVKLLDIQVRQKENELKVEELKERNAKDVLMAKVEKRRIWVENLVRVAGFAAGLGGTTLALMADQRGWYVSKLALGQNPKLNLR